MTAPGSPFIRRAVRMTLIVPTVVFVLTVVLHQPRASLPASFAMFALTVFAHFSGPPRSRLIASSATAAAGLAVIALGCLAGLNLWVALPATLVMVFAIGYAGVLRGYFAPASAALLVPWIFGVTSGTPVDGIPTVLIGWTIGAVAAVLADQFIWPDDAHDDLRPLLGRCMQDAAALVSTRWIDGRFDPAAMDRLDASIAAVDSAFVGRADRPGAATRQDRGFLVAFNGIRRLRTDLWSDQPVTVPAGLDDPPPSGVDLARTTADSLNQAAAALTTHGPIPDPRVIDAARQKHREQVSAWAGSIPTQNADDAYAAITSTFDLTAASLATESILIGLDPQAADEPTLLGKPPSDTLAGRLVGQWRLQSPWFRKALRTAVSIAVTVVIVKLGDLDFGLWVSLGAMAALKADSSGTRRSAEQIVLGTIGGFVVGATLITIIGPRPIGYWLVVPLAVFLAAYTPGRTAMTISQGAFTVFILMMVGISEPGRYLAAEMRVVNVTLGVTVSLLVSLAMWPHGAAAMVRQTVRAAADKASGFAAASFERLTGGSPRGTTADQAQPAVTLAAETLDLAVSQRGPGLPDVADWMLVLNTASHYELIGRIVADMADRHPLPCGCTATRRELVETSSSSHRDVVTAVTALTDRPPRKGAGDVLEAPWLTTNRALARERPASVGALDVAARDDTADLIRHGTGDAMERGRGATAIAYATGWAALGAQLAQRLTALAAAGKSAAATSIDQVSK